MGFKVKSLLALLEKRMWSSAFFACFSSQSNNWFPIVYQSFWPGWARLTWFKARQWKGKFWSWFCNIWCWQIFRAESFFMDASVASRDPMPGSIWAPQMHVKLSPQPITFSIQPQLPSVEEKSVWKHLATLKMFVFRFFPFLKIILITHFSLKNHSALVSVYAKI